jgi:glycosyltransferase involved in cell wall biosynthesis
MCFYGDPTLLYRAVHSVRRLEDTDWELTVFDDCCAAGPEVERFLAELDDPRLHYVRNERNLGLAGNTFGSMKFAKKDFYTIMDHDDIMLPNYGHVVGRLFEKYPDALVAQPGVEVIDGDDRTHRPLQDRVKQLAGPINTETVVSGEAGVAGLLRGNWTYAPSICYRRRAADILTFRENTDSLNDLTRLVDLLRAGGSLAVSSEVAFRYRRHNTNHSRLTAKSGARFMEERQYFIQIATELEQMGWNTAARAARRRLFSRLNALTQVPGALASGNVAMVKALAGHAFR